jgi:hypothetical protein
MYNNRKDLTMHLLALAYRAAEGRTLGNPSKQALSCHRQQFVKGERRETREGGSDMWSCSHRPR